MSKKIKMLQKLFNKHMQYVCITQKFDANIFTFTANEYRLQISVISHLTTNERNRP